MKIICNLQITEADTDFFSKSLCNCLPTPLAHHRKVKHTSKLVGKFVFAFLFHFYDTQINIHIEHEQCFHGQMIDTI